MVPESIVAVGDSHSKCFENTNLPGDGYTNRRPSLE